MSFIGKILHQIFRNCFIATVPWWCSSLSSQSRRICSFCSITKAEGALTTCFYLWKSFYSKSIQNNFLLCKCTSFCILCSLSSKTEIHLPSFKESSGFQILQFSRSTKVRLPAFPSSAAGSSEQRGQQAKTPLCVPDNTKLSKSYFYVHLLTPSTDEKKKKRMHSRGTLVPTMEFISLERYFP